MWSKWDYLAAFRVNLADHMLSLNSGGLGMFGEQGIDFFQVYGQFFSSGVSDTQLTSLSIPSQATPSPPSPLPAPTLSSRSAHPWSCAARVWRRCSGSGRSGRRCGERKRWTGCPRCTSPGLSLFTWAATSAWRRAPRRQPLFTSTWKVDGRNCLLILTCPVLHECANQFY